MREIIFRAQRIVDLKWHYGSYLYPSTIVGKDSNIPLTIYNDTLCQYSGLEDKNGTKIFESDIVKTIRYNKFIDYWIVKFECGSFCFKHYGNQDHTMSASTFDYDYADFSEVVGNIYDNPELLNKIEGLNAKKI